MEKNKKTMTHADALQIARKKRAEMVANGEVVARVTPLEFIVKNPDNLSLRKRINAKCWDCQEDTAIGRTRERIKHCTCGNTCPLWAIRPYRDKNSNGTVES